MKIGYLLEQHVEIRQPPFGGPANHVREVVQKLLDQAKQLGAIPELPPDLARKLEKGDVQNLSQEELDQLAEALEDALEGEPQQGQGDPGELQDGTEQDDLKRLLEEKEGKR